MRARLPAGLLGILVGLGLLVPAARGQGGTVASSYLQTFAGMPTTPAAYRPPGWDMQIHSRDSQTWTALEPMVAQHGPACEGPPATHALGGDYPSHVFQCHDHVMTAIQAGGYGVIYLTPPALLDWSQGEAVLRFDMSTLRTSLRDWVDVWLTPYADHLALPLHNGFEVDLAGAPPNALHIKMGDFNGESTWSLATLVNGVETDVTGGVGFTWPSIEAVVQPAGGPSPTRRDTFELRVRNGHLGWGMPGYGTTWVDSDSAPLGFTQAVVQFGHHAYNGRKDCGVEVPAVSCAPNTWHWSNVYLSPALPISITPLSPRQLTDAAPGGWAFPAPAGADTTLQFSADSAPVDVPSVALSWDGGATWQTTLPAPSGAPGHDPQHARSYRVAVPVGATRVEVQGTGGAWGPTWRAKDASLWQISGARPVTPTPPALPTIPPATAIVATPTARPATLTVLPLTLTAVPLTLTAVPLTATATPTPPATATAQASMTLVPPTPTTAPGATATPVPTSTSVPAATATPPPSGGCSVTVQRASVVVATWTCQ